MRVSDLQCGLLLAGMIGAVMCGGCTETRNNASGLHPFDARRPFEEVGVDLDGYKSVQMRGNQDDELCLVMAISGGGERAAAFATGIFIGLERLKKGVEEEQRNAMQEVDYFSTVSGGGMAAGVYISKLHDHLNPQVDLEEGEEKLKGRVEDFSFEREVFPELWEKDREHVSNKRLGVRDSLSRSYVDDLVEGLFTIFSSVTIDRGDFLEQRFDTYLLDYQSRKESIRLRDMFVDEGDVREVEMPYLVANATIFENGHIFPFIPNQLERYEVSGYMHRLQDVDVEDYDGDYHALAMSVPLSLALKSSGTFPVAIPATTLKSDFDKKYNPYLHLLDGGLADNLGVVTGLRLMKAERHTNVKRRVLMVVDAFKDGYAPFSKWAQAPGEASTAVRVADIAIDSWRGRVREMVMGLAKSGMYGEGIEVVNLSFDDFYTTLTSTASFSDLIGFGLTKEDMEKLGVVGEELKLIHGRRPTPYLLAREISTSYRISEAEFNFLVAVGRYLVYQEEEKIRKALGWEIMKPVEEKVGVE